MLQKREAQLAAELMRARIRLGMIARMAELNMENTPRESEFAEVMQTILAASTLEDKPSTSH